MRSDGRRGAIHNRADYVLLECREREWHAFSGRDFLESVTHYTFRHPPAGLESKSCSPCGAKGKG